MIFKAIAICGAAALALAATAGGALAQAGAGAAPATPPITYGPPISGVCVVSTNAVVGESQVGKSVMDRLEQLGKQAQAELQTEGTDLATEQKALQAATTRDQAREQAFEAKATQFEKLREQRAQELQATQQKQVNRVLAYLQPVLAQVFQQKQCSILLDADHSVIFANSAMDLTAAAVLGLNAKVTTLTFDRETLTADQTANQQ